MDDLRKEVDQIRIIDTHEHIRKQADISREGVSLFTSLKYSILWPDFISAGMPPKQWESHNVSPQDGWNRIQPFINSVQTTGYFTTLMIAYRDLFGFEDKDITDNNWRRLSDSISEAYQRPDLYSSVIKKLNVEKMLIDVIEDPGSLEMPDSADVYVPTFAIDPLIFVKSHRFYVANPTFSPQWFNPNPLDNLLKKWKVSYETFEEYLALIDLAFDKLKKAGGVAIKFRFAYARGMEVQHVEKGAAEKVFYTDDAKVTREQARLLEDYLIRLIIQKATVNKIPIQVHSGLFGNCGNDPRKGHPFQLINLFTEYPDAKFILFHGSYPFTGEMTTLVKGFPNVYLDICWTPWILYNNLQKYLSEWLAMIPCNKIMVGGDSECIERFYAAMTVAKHCIVDVLTDYVARDVFTRRTAINVAKKLLRENAESIYKLDLSSRGKHHAQV